MTQHCVAKRLKVNGIVQGVGFRPFVFQLAEKFNLKGEVANTSSGVSIHIAGAPEDVAAFERDRSEKSPPLAYIVEISSQVETVCRHVLRPRGYRPICPGNDQRQFERRTEKWP